MLDALTGIPNRRAADEALETALGGTGPLMVMLVDVDHFKRVNDTHGHSVGDSVLRNVARTLQRFIRQGDIVARYGGEEFFLLIRGARPDIGEMIAERFRRGVAEMTIEGVPGLDNITVSIGVAAWHGTGTKPLAPAMIEIADAALYAAKGAGRNRIALSRVEVAPPVSLRPHPKELS